MLQSRTSKILCATTKMQYSQRKEYIKFVMSFQMKLKHNMNKVV